MQHVPHDLLAHILSVYVFPTEEDLCYMLACLFVNKKFYSATKKSTLFRGAWKDKHCAISPHPCGVALRNKRANFYKWVKKYCKQKTDEEDLCYAADTLDEDVLEGTTISLTPKLISTLAERGNLAYLKTIEPRIMHDKKLAKGIMKGALLSGNIDLFIFARAFYDSGTFAEATDKHIPLIKYICRSFPNEFPMWYRDLPNVAIKSGSIRLYVLLVSYGLRASYICDSLGASNSPQMYDYLVRKRCIQTADEYSTTYDAAVRHASTILIDHMTKLGHIPSTARTPSETILAIFMAAYKMKRLEPLIWLSQRYTKKHLIVGLSADSGVGLSVEQSPAFWPGIEWLYDYSPIIVARMMNSPKEPPSCGFVRRMNAKGLWNPWIQTSPERPPPKCVRDALGDHYISFAEYTNITEGE